MSTLRSPLRAHCNGTVISACPDAHERRRGATRPGTAPKAHRAGPRRIRGAGPPPGTCGALHARRLGPDRDGGGHFRPKTKPVRPLRLHQQRGSPGPVRPRDHPVVDAPAARGALSPAALQRPIVVGSPVFPPSDGLLPSALAAVVGRWSAWGARALTAVVCAAARVSRGGRVCVGAVPRCAAHLARQSRGTRLYRSRRLGPRGLFALAREVAVARWVHQPRPFLGRHVGRGVLALLRRIRVDPRGREAARFGDAPSGRLVRLFRARYRLLGRARCAALRRPRLRLLPQPAQRLRRVRPRCAAPVGHLDGGGVARHRRHMDRLGLVGARGAAAWERWPSWRGRSPTC